MSSEFYFGTHALGDENLWFSTQLATWLSVTYPSAWEPCTRTRPTSDRPHPCMPPFSFAAHALHAGTPSTLLTYFQPIKPPLSHYLHTHFHIVILHQLSQYPFSSLITTSTSHLHAWSFTCMATLLLYPYSLTSFCFSSHHL